MKRLMWLSVFLFIFKRSRFSHTGMRCDSRSEFKLQASLHESCKVE